MPLMRVTHQRGAITEAQKARLAEELTAALLIGEVGADTPAGRAVAYVLFDEVDPKTSWFVGGKPDLEAPKAGRFLVDIVYPFGSTPQAENTALHAAINDIISRTLDTDVASGRGTDWVMIHDVADGNWGAGGNTVGIAEINQALNGVPERKDYFEPLIAAQRRMQAAHGYPAGAARS